MRGSLLDWKRPTKNPPPTGEGGGSRGAWLDRVRRAKSLPPCGGARGVRKSQTAWLFQPSADAAVPQRQAFRPKGEKTDEGAFVNIHHLIRRSAPPSPHRGRNTGAAHCFIGCGQPKAFPLLPLWEAANQKPSLGGRWRLSRKAKTTDEGKVITITNPFLYNSPPPHQSSAPCGLQLLHPREKPALARLAA